jgi:hypothetical protein
MKKAHLLRCARTARSNVLLKYASARGFFARLASGTFLTRLETEFFNTLIITYQKELARRMDKYLSKLPGEPDGI